MPQSAHLADDVTDIHVVFPPNPAREQLSALAAHLLEHRQAILDAWRAYGGDILPDRNIAASLSFSSRRHTQVCCTASRSVVIGPILSP